MADGRLDPLVGRESAFGEFRDPLESALAGWGVGKTVLRLAEFDSRRGKPSSDLAN